MNNILHHPTPPGNIWKRIPNHYAHETTEVICPTDQDAPTEISAPACHEQAEEFPGKIIEGNNWETIYLPERQNWIAKIIDPITEVSFELIDQDDYVDIPLEDTNSSNDLMRLIQLKKMYQCISIGQELDIWDRSVLDWKEDGIYTIHKGKQWKYSYIIASNGKRPTWSTMILNAESDEKEIVMWARMLFDNNERMVIGMNRAKSPEQIKIISKSPTIIKNISIEADYTIIDNYTYKK